MNLIRHTGRLLGGVQALVRKGEPKQGTPGHNPMGTTQLMQK